MSGAGRKSSLLLTIFLMALLLSSTNGGPAAQGVCYAGCAAMVVACYAAAGFVFGTVTAGVGELI